MTYLRLATLLVLFQFTSIAHSKTFSCGGVYEDLVGIPYASMHQELSYDLNDTTELLELHAEDSLYRLHGSLKVNEGKEFISIEIIQKDKEFSIFNNNSQVGQLYSNSFNFVFIGMKKIGFVTTSKGAQINASVGTFQCQTY